MSESIKPLSAAKPAVQPALEADPGNPVVAETSIAAVAGDRLDRSPHGRPLVSVDAKAGVTLPGKDVLGNRGSQLLARAGAVLDGGAPGISVEKLEAARSELVSDLSDTQAVRLLHRAVMDRSDGLSVKSARWLQKQIDLSPGLERAQRAVETLFADAVLVDHNLNGKLDGSDLVISVDAAGETRRLTVSQLEPKTRIDLEIGAAMLAGVEVAGRMSRVASVEDQEFAPSHWDNYGPGCFFARGDRTGEREKRALTHLTQHASDYKAVPGTLESIPYAIAMNELFDEAGLAVIAHPYPDQATSSLRLGSSEQWRRTVGGEIDVHRHPIHFGDADLSAKLDGTPASQATVAAIFSELHAGDEVVFSAKERKVPWSTATVRTFYVGKDDGGMPLVWHTDYGTLTVDALRERLEGEPEHGGYRAFRFERAYRFLTNQDQARDGVIAPRDPRKIADALNVFAYTSDRRWHVEGE